VLTGIAVTNERARGARKGVAVDAGRALVDSVGSAAGITAIGSPLAHRGINLLMEQMRFWVVCIGVLIAYSPATHSVKAAQTRFSA
jgi:hypothetical protein